MFVYGDSHAANTFRGVGNDRSMSSKTMHGVGKRRCVENFYPAEHTKDSLLVFCFGEVDCRFHIQNQINLGRQEDAIIDELVSAYLSVINRSVGHVVVVAVIPPTRQCDYEAKNGPITHHLPFLGTDEARVRYTRKMNARLSANALFFDPYPPYTRPDGCLKFDLSDGNVHIGDNTMVKTQWSQFKVIEGVQFDLRGDAGGLCIALDTVDHGAFGHFVYESAILLPLIKHHMPRATVCVEPRRYKKLLLDHFGLSCEPLPDPHIIATPRPMRMIARAHPRFQELLAQFANALRVELPKTGKLLVLPRQSAENYPGNAPSEDLSYQKIIASRPCSVLHTDSVPTLAEQIRLVAQHEDIVVSDGSAFLVNGLFASGTIHVVGRLCTQDQATQYECVRFVLNYIMERNTVFFYTSEEDYLARARNV